MSVITPKRSTGPSARGWQPGKAQAKASHTIIEQMPAGLVNMAKMFSSEEIMKVAQHAVELHGGNGIMLDFGIEKVLRDAVIFMHMDATVDISKFKIVKNMFPHTAGKYAGPEA